MSTLRRLPAGAPPYPLPSITRKKLIILEDNHTALLPSSISLCPVKSCQALLEIRSCLYPTIFREEADPCDAESEDGQGQGASPASARKGE